MGNMETVRTIIDTDILIDLLRDKKEAISFIAQLECENLTLCTTVINIFELHHGAHKSKEPEKNLQAVNKLLRRASYSISVIQVCSKGWTCVCRA